MKKSENSLPAVDVPPPMVALDSKGAELPSPISLVSVVDARPVSLGDRIRRYTNAGHLQQHLNDPSLWDDEEIEAMALEQEIPMTKYEGRADDLYKEIQRRQTVAREAALAELAEKEKADNARFAAQYKALQEAGSIPATPLPATPSKPSPASPDAKGAAPK